MAITKGEEVVKEFAIGEETYRKLGSPAISGGEICKKIVSLSYGKA